MSSKNFTTLRPKADKLDLGKKVDAKEMFASHKREFSLPDYLHVDFPDRKILRETMKTAAANRGAQT